MNQANEPPFNLFNALPTPIVLTAGAALHPIQIDGVTTVGVQAQPAGILPLAVPKRYPTSETLFKNDEVSQSRTTLISIM